MIVFPDRNHTSSAGPTENSAKEMIKMSFTETEIFGLAALLATAPVEMADEEWIPFCMAHN